MPWKEFFAKQAEAFTFPEAGAHAQPGMGKSQLPDWGISMVVLVQSRLDE
jgi:hypothetical protein